MAHADTHNMLLLCLPLPLNKIRCTSAVLVANRQNLECIVECQNSRTQGLSTLISQSIFVGIEQVEIVMNLEEEFGINVDEDKAQDISTIQQAADVIEMLLEKKTAA